MKAVLLGCLALGVGSTAEAARKPASDSACRAHALTAVEASIGGGTDTRVRTVTAGKKYEVTVGSDADDEVTYEAEFADGCDNKPEVREVDADSDVAEAHSSKHFGSRCLQGEVYHQGKCCKHGEGDSLNCPPSKPSPHLHDLPRH